MSECVPDCKYKQKYFNSKYKKFDSRCYEYVCCDNYDKHNMETLWYRLEKYDLLHYTYNLDGFNNTLLHFITYSLNTEYFDKLQAIGYDFNIKDPTGDNAFSSLNNRYSNDIETTDVAKFTNMMKTLCKYGADINNKNNKGKTFIHCLCKTSFMCGKGTFTTIVKTFVELGGDLTIKNNNGDTPYSMLANSYFTEKYHEGKYSELKYIYAIFKEQVLELKTEYIFELLEEEDLGWSIIMDKLKEQDKLDYALSNEDYWNNTLLHQSVYNLDTKMINLLIEANYNINVIEGYKGSNALRSLIKYVKSIKNKEYNNFDESYVIINTKRLLCRNGIDSNKIGMKGSFKEYINRLRDDKEESLFAILLEELVSDDVCDIVDSIDEEDVMIC